MRVVLPSDNSKTVELRLPCFEDIINLEFVEGSRSIKTKLVEFCSNLSNIDEISILDRDFLFLLLATAFNNDELHYTVKCPHCDKKFKTTISISDLDVIDLKSPKVYGLWIRYRYYQFKLLTVADEKFCIDKTLSWEGYDENTINDLLASKTIISRKFDYTSLENFKKSFSRLPLRAAMIAYDFQKLIFHGMLPLFEVNCISCGKLLQVPFEVTGDIIRLSETDIIALYNSVSTIVTFDSFKKMTYTQYKALYELNKK